jgi:hypothetical protein
MEDVLETYKRPCHPKRPLICLDETSHQLIASSYEAFPPETARRIAERFEIHHTPKHGSWLNMAGLGKIVAFRLTICLLLC